MRFEMVIADIVLPGMPYLHPQEACGLFALLRETESGKTESPRPLDISPECCTLLEKLMLTQAQVRSRGGGRWCTGIAVSSRPCEHMNSICSLPYMHTPAPAAAHAAHWLPAPRLARPELSQSSQHVRMLPAAHPRPAQECVYHKAVIDKKSPSVLARLAKQVRPGRHFDATRLLAMADLHTASRDTYRSVSAHRGAPLCSIDFVPSCQRFGPPFPFSASSSQTGTMYDEVDRAFNAPALANYFDKSWQQHVSLKSSIYQVRPHGCRQGPLGGHRHSRLGVRVKREKPCEVSGKHGNGNAGACT